MFLMLTLYMQQVLGYSAMKTGVAYLAVAGSAIVTSGIAAQLVNRLGVKPVLIVGMTALTAGLVYFTQVSVGGSYSDRPVPGLAPGRGRPRLLVRADLDRGARRRAAGRGWVSLRGCSTRSQQIGGALGIAALSAIATSTTTSDLSSGTTPAFALTNGFQDAFIAGAIIAFVRVLVSVFVVSRRDLTEEVPEVEPAFEQAA